MRHVLILTRLQDQHLPPVAQAIRTRGAQAVVFNPATFPEEVTLTARLDALHTGWSGLLQLQGQSLPLDALTSIWRRRPETYKASPSYQEAERAFIEEEAERALLGVLDSAVLQGTLWVSRTHSVRRADLKALQLAQAQRLGFRTPRTLITNDPQACKRFYEQCRGQVILKSVSRGIIKDSSQQIDRFIYTSQVREEHLPYLEQVRVTAHLLQEYFPGKLDIRVVVIGRQVFAAEIHSPHLDFRQHYQDLSYAVHTLPEAILNKVRALVHAFDLQFSSMDLLLTPEGDYIFLDLNPNGQWLWLEHSLHPHLPLVEAMADLLVFPKEHCL